MQSGGILEQPDGDGDGDGDGSKNGDGDGSKNGDGDGSGDALSIRAMRRLSMNEDVGS